MLDNCFRFAPRDSIPGLIAKICKYLKDHPGWSEVELEEQIKKFISATGVESFNGRTGTVTLNKNDVNNLKIASAYFAEGDESIDSLDIASLYNQGVRFVFTDFNSVTSGYNLAFVLDYFSGSGNVVYYPMSTGSGGGGNIVSVNGKTGVVELSLSDIIGTSGVQVKLCTATEFASATTATWNAYYNEGYRIVGVVNSNDTAIDYIYILKQNENNHTPIALSTDASDAYTPTNPPPYPVDSVNSKTGTVELKVVDVSNGNSSDKNAYIFIDENDNYPATIASDSSKLGGKLPAFYATADDVSPLLYNNAGAHNAVYRGKELGTAVTDAQLAAIAAGTFEDMYIGDYWTIDGIVYRIAAFDYYYKTGDISCDVHHVTLVPDVRMYNHVMNDTGVTTGAYVGSKMYTEGLTQAKNTINNAFGSSHVLNHRQYLQNAVTNGYASAGSWYDSTVELMTEQNVYGCRIFGNMLNGTSITDSYTVDNSQYPLFKFRHDMISNGIGGWLRDVASNAHFTAVNINGRAAYATASYALSVRPAFSIC